jgi:hypothetical protein
MLQPHKERDGVMRWWKVESAGEMRWWKVWYVVEVLPGVWWGEWREWVNGFSSMERFSSVKHSIFLFLVLVLLCFMRENKLYAFMYIIVKNDN